MDGSDLADFEATEPSVYCPQEGDAIDQALAEEINREKLHFPLRRTAQGSYSVQQAHASKPEKLHVRVVRGIPLIRVGGGWVNVKSFVKSKSFRTQRTRKDVVEVIAQAKTQGKVPAEIVSLESVVVHIPPQEDTPFRIPLSELPNVITSTLPPSALLDSNPFESMTSTPHKLVSSTPTGKTSKASARLASTPRHVKASVPTSGNKTATLRKSPRLAGKTSARSPVMSTPKPPGFKSPAFGRGSEHKPSLTSPLKSTLTPVRAVPCVHGRLTPHSPTKVTCTPQKHIPTPTTVRKTPNAAPPSSNKPIIRSVSTPSQPMLSTSTKHLETMPSKQTKASSIDRALPHYAHPLNRTPARSKKTQEPQQTPAKLTPQKRKIEQGTPHYALPLQRTPKPEIVPPTRSPMKPKTPLNKRKIETDSSKPESIDKHEIRRVVTRSNLQNHDPSVPPNSAADSFHSLASICEDIELRKVATRKSDVKGSAPFFSPTRDFARKQRVSTIPSARTLDLYRSNLTLRSALGSPAKTVLFRN